MRYQRVSAAGLAVLRPICVKLRRSGRLRYVSLVIMLSMIAQLVLPTVSYALTGGPTSPEFSSFEPVATTNMVNEFTGGFMYNVPVIEIPGANGAGYALSLSYHAGDGPESEASWVGNGWTLNPGAITRNKRGLPDDYKGNTVHYYNNVPKNWTVAMSPMLGLELFSAIGASISQTVRYNNYKGFGFATGVGLSLFGGGLSLGMNLSEGDVTFSPAVNPAKLLDKSLTTTRTVSTTNSGLKSSKEVAKAELKKAGQWAKSNAYSFLAGGLNGGLTHYINYMLTDMTSPYSVTPYQGGSWSGMIQFTPDPPPAPISVSSLGGSMSYNYQKNIPDRDVKTWGYMYSGHTPDNNSSDSEGIMDYTIDKPSNFNKRDKYLPVPFSTPDAYFISGEGLGGSFRMYNDKIGIFSPNYVESNTTPHYFGVDLHVGDDIGAGAEAIIDGYHKLRVASAWPDGVGNNADFKFAKYGDADAGNRVSEPVFFRFNNDLGGQVNYTESDRPERSSITPDLPTDFKELIKDRSVEGGHRRSARSQYIGFHTNKEINKRTSTGKRALAYEQRETIHTQAGRNDGENFNLDDQVGEISVNNEDGNNYIYGLPVYTAHEKNMQQGITSVANAPTLCNNYWVYGDIVNNSTKVGEEYTTPYASAYLLTQITTPDYIDVNLNGADDEDFGGYTRFSYKQEHGYSDKNQATRMYKWRAPYNGVYFNAARLSDNRDNMGIYQSGYKEIYYLDTVETKTHFAVFRTSDREDGYEANTDDGVAAASASARGTMGLKKLDKIDLYAKAGTGSDMRGTLIKTVYFEYDYSSWPHCPSNIATTGPKGKLTLKKVWSEYNGVISASVSPYQFEYTYPTSANYPSKYSNLLMPSSLAETPDYTRDIDCWGNYMDSGFVRRNRMQSWPGQNPAASFDPAAWQLKRIILPSGGEIHIQYEQNTYAYVQNRPASVMVPILEGLGSVYTPDQNGTGSDFGLDLSRLGGLISTSADKQRLLDLIKSVYIGNKGKKEYFKFLYTLMGTNIETLGSCNADYIDGYGRMDDAWIDANNNIMISLVDNEPPRKLCLDYIRHEIGGMIMDGNCAPGNARAMKDPGEDGDLIGSLQEMANELVNAVKVELAPNLTGCKRVKADMSYLRIPVWNKKGGGVRVKRLLMFNKGVDANSPELYGTEYIYENEMTHESYGVATNEPAENKEENPWVDFLLKRDEQDNVDKLIAGKDREQFEGPTGAPAMPQASIGYSTVIKKNIHQTKSTGGGYSVVNYYTAKDYPFDMYYGALDYDMSTPYSDHENHKDAWDLDIGFFSYTINTGFRCSQGYSFIQNQMHGQMKSTADYAGTYTKERHYDNIFPVTPVQQTSYEYYEPGEKIPMLDPASYSIYYDRPGREMDVTVERRSVVEESSETRLTGDFTIGYVAPAIEIPYPIAFPITSGSNQHMNMIVTNKVIHYPAVVKRITTAKEGNIQKTENLAFDPLTTKAIVTRTYDGYDGLKLGGSSTPHDGSYTSYNFPASSQYRDMGQKAWNEHYCYYTGSGSPVTPLISGSSPNFTYTFNGISSDIFHVGDMIALHTTGGGVSVGHVIGASGNSLAVKSSIRYNATIANTTYNKIEIVKSGYTNQLNSSSGGYTVYGKLPTSDLPQFLTDINQALYDILTGPYPNSITIDMTAYSFKFIVGGCASFNGTLAYTSIVLIKTGPTTYEMQIGYDGNPPFPALPPGIFSTFVNTINPSLIPNQGFCIVPQSPNPGFNLGINNGQTNLGGSFNDKVQLCDPIVYNYIKANTISYGDNWPYPTPYTVPVIATVPLNVYESGERGKWRPVDNYVFKKETKPGSDANAGQRNYDNAGTATMPIATPWINTPSLLPTKWVHTSQATRYTPNGSELEETDALGIFSTSKFGYHGILPYAIAQNAQSSSVRFESFENTYVNGSVTNVEDGVVINGTINNFGHTGYQSFRLDGGASGSPGTIQFTGMGPSGSGHLIRFWMNGTNTPTDVEVKVGPSTILPVIKVAEVSGWTLFEARNTASVTLADYTIKNNTSTTILNIDDIRIQPIESQLAAYVYDTKTLKLSATIDDQNFATIYQYNGEGKLVRKLIETTKGIRTVEEAQYHLPSIPR